MVVEQGRSPFAPRSTQLLVLCFVVLCLLGFSASAAHADTFTVTTTADIIGSCPSVSACSLRSAIIAANLHPGPDLITLGNGLTYTLALSAPEAPGVHLETSGDLDISVSPTIGDLTIDGNNSTVNAAQIDRVFDIEGLGLVTINDLSITGGLARGFLSFGGGISIRNAALLLNHCTVSGNATTPDATDAPDNGGGISVVGTYDAAAGTATLASLSLTNGSSVSGNTGLNGGGILCVLCQLSVSANSSISGNTATGSDGGGIDLVGNLSTLSFTGGTLASNVVTGPGGRGGGLSVPFGTSAPVLTRNRIAANTAPGAKGIFADVATVTATDNWWGCNFGAGVGDGNVTCVGTPNGIANGLGSVTTTPYLKLRTTASPATIATGASSTATADLTFNSASADTSAGGTVPNGMVAAFSGTLGTFSPATAATAAGKATNGYTNGGTSGSATLTAVVDGQTASTTVTVLNTPPTLNPITDPAAILEDAGLQTVSLSGISAGASEVQPLTVTATSNNTGLIPNPAVTYSSPSATGSLSYTPAANANGSAIITVTVDDGGTGTHTVVRTFTVNVTAVNDAPTLNAIADPVAILEDAALQTVNLSGITAGGGETQVLTVTATSNNTALIPNPAVTYTSPNAIGSLTYTPVANASGAAIVTVTVTDDGGGTNTFQRTFTVNVTAVNDPPTLDPIADPAAILEDAALQTVNLSGISAGGGETQTLTVTATSNNTALIPNPAVSYTSANATGSLSYTPVPNANGSATITVTVDDGGTGTHTVVRTFTVSVTPVNDPPTLNPIADPVAIAEDAAAQTVNLAGIGAGAGESQTVTVTAASSNTSLIPNPAVTYTSPNATGSLTYAPVADASGSAIVTVTVGDGVTTVQQTFTVTVTPVNDPPTLNAIANPAAILEDAAQQTVLLAGISAGGGESQPLTVTATSNNSALIPNPAVTYASPDATGSLSYTPVSNASGSAIITVTVSDDGGGTNTFSRTFTVNVTAVNDTPTLDAIADPAAILEDAALQTVNLSGITAGAGEVQPLTVTATSNNPGLIPNPAVSYSSPSATGSLSYTPAANANGSAIITVTVDDGGTGTHTVVRTFTVNVTAVNDAPTLNAIADPAAILEDAPLQTVNLSGITAGGGETQVLTVTATSNNTALIPNPAVVYTTPNAIGSLSYTPVANASGAAIVTVTVTDDGGGTNTFQRTFTVNVTAVNDAPTLDAIADPAAILEDAALQTVNLSGISAGGGETQTLTVTATSNNTALIPNPAVSYSSANATGSLSYTPVPNANGSATITVTVDDGGTGTHTVVRTFTVNVTSVNDLPTLAAIADRSAGANGAVGIPLTIGDVETAASALLVSATSSNQAVVPNAGLVVSAGGTSRTLTLTAGDQVGTAIITVTVTDGNGGTATRTFTVTVVTALSIADASIVEGNSGTTNLVFTVALGGPSASTVSATYATRQRTAIEGVDYLGVTGTVTFAPGATTATILVPVAGDTKTEIDETFFVSLTAPIGAVFTDAEAVGTIVNDDPTSLQTAELVTWGRKAGVVANGASITMTSATGWTSGANSSRALKIGDGSVEFSTTAANQEYILGLKRAFTSIDLNAIDFSVYLRGDGFFDVFENGVYPTSTFGPYAAGDRFAITVTGGVVSYQRNGTTFYTSGTAASYPLRVDAALYTTGSTIADVVLAGRLAPIAAVAGDVDNDGKSDLTVFRPTGGMWHTLKSSTGFAAISSVSWGLPTDVTAAGDYDGDGKMDLAIFRPSTGLWAILKSSTNFTTSVTVSWGLPTDTPVPADYDGDGRTDPAVFRPSTGGWYILKSSTNYGSSMAVSWGLSSDQPVPSDYDGDGRADPAIFRSNGLWAILKSSTNYTTSMTVSWGLGTDVAVPGDYDGDGKSDPAVFRASTGGWYLLKSSTNYGSSTGVSWGLSTDMPVPADYDGDGRFDPAVWRASNGKWIMLRSTTSYTTSGIVTLGLPSDLPINRRP